jgi:hypothetical protein
MRVLGFAQAHEQISQQNLDRYSKLLLQPLTPPPQIQSLATLFGWGVLEEF